MKVTREATTSGNETIAMMHVSYYVLWTIVTNSCGGLMPFIGFGCPGDSSMELVNSFTVANDGHDPICSVTGPSEGVCTEEQPASALSGGFIIQTGVIFRCYGNNEQDVLGWATLPDQSATCTSVESTAYHAAAISLLRDYQGDNKEIRKDYSCSLGFSTLVDGGKAYADMSGSYGLQQLRELTVVQNAPIPDAFVIKEETDPTPCKRFLQVCETDGECCSDDCGFLFLKRCGFFGLFG